MSDVRLMPSRASSEVPPQEKVADTYGPATRGFLRDLGKSVLTGLYRCSI